MPHRSSVPMFWRIRKGKYSLIGSECNECGGLQFPKRNVCPRCRSINVKDKRFSGLGIIESYTTIHVAPAGFNAPYNVAIIKLDEGPMIAAEVVDKSGLEIGKRVRAVFRKHREDGESGLILYGVKFELLE